MSWDKRGGITWRGEGGCEGEEKTSGKSLFLKMKVQVLLSLSWRTCCSADDREAHG